MRVKDVVDAMELLYRAADHPEVVEVSRFGRDTEPGGQSPPGVKLLFRSGTSALLAASVPPRPAPEAVPLTAELPSPSPRVTRTLALTMRLLDYARPPVFKSWETCAYPGVHLKPSAVRINCTDGDVVYLRVTVASGPSRDPEADLYPEYEIPEGVRAWPPGVSAAPAVPE
ncbi:hypothetical protein ACLQ25_19825 [Micromonospora sp. DT44]|uniref:hypothetical protein n=1 Tax=Micromonospora sp. DT44 TaxID=3393439 RepID=UPI003CF98AF1